MTVLSSCGLADDGKAEPPGSWRSLPLITDGKVDPGWAQIGWGGFVVDDGALRTECDERGMGLLLWRREKLGDCQIRVVYKCKEARSNAGVFVRIDDGILKRLEEKPDPARRKEGGGLAEGSIEKFMNASDKEHGPWYAVHHGYEVQICDDSDEYHRTGAIYSLARAEPVPERRQGEWRTMVITLKGSQVLVDVDQKRITVFDSEGKDAPRERKWFEPRREPRRPTSGYIGLQNHDPGDVVQFKEVSVRPLPGRP
jgi:hypothetical protein